MSQTGCNVAELPLGAMEYIVKLRQESQRFRHQRNAARGEVGQLRVTVAHLRAEAEALRAELAK